MRLLNVRVSRRFGSSVAERSPNVSYLNRETQRPAVSRLSVSWGHGPVTIELGKQFGRWGKIDILNPTDRFTPRDYLTVIDATVLAVTAARLGSWHLMARGICHRVQHYLPEFEKRWSRFALPVSGYWRMDETYVKDNAYKPREFLVDLAPRSRLELTTH